MSSNGPIGWPSAVRQAVSMSSTDDDTLLQQGDRLVADGTEDPVGDEARDLLVQHDRLLAEPARERGDRLHRLR